MMKKTRFLRWTPAWVLLMVPMTASALEAGECETNADCEGGAVCQKAQWVEECSAPDSADDTGDGVSPPPGEGDDPPSADDLGDPGSGPRPLPPECDSTVHEEEIGRCVVPPTPCTEDSDCGEYERCHLVNVGSTCGVSSDGASDGSSEDGSPPPAEDCPEAPEAETQTGTCGPGSFSCESSDDCPREFDCVVTSGGTDDGCACVTEPCDCDSITKETTSCVPKAIECDSDAECPEDWECQGTESVTCSGGGGSSEGSADDGSDPGEGVPTPTSDGVSDDSGDGSTDAPPPDREEECTTVKQKGACLPKAWSSSSGSPGAGDPRDDGAGHGGDDLSWNEGDDGTPPPDKDGSAPGEGTPTSQDGDGVTEENGDTSVSKGGCSVGPRMTSPSPGVWAFGIALMGVFVRRRRRAA